MPAGELFVLSCLNRFEQVISRTSKQLCKFFKHDHIRTSYTAFPLGDTNGCDSQCLCYLRLGIALFDPILFQCNYFSFLLVCFTLFSAEASTDSF